MSLLKLSEHTTQTTRILRASLAEQDLQYKLTKALSDPADCFYNLKLSHLSDPTNRKGALSSLVQTNRNNSGDTPNLTDDITLIEPGEFRSALNIVKIELANKTPYNPFARTLTVYYKKKYGGGQETLDGKPCTAGNGANDQAGCYFKACKVDYRFDPISKKVTTCSLLDCSSRGRGGPGIVGISCAKNQYLRGFDNRGTAICGDLSACPEGKILTGVKNDGSKACGVDLSECADIPVPDTAICKERCKGGAENESNKDCKCIKTTFRGIGPSGERICEKVAQLGQDCPVKEGRQTVMKGFDEHGKIVCEVPCTGGRKWDGSGCVCEGTDRVWNGLACVCGVGTHWDGLTCVTCPGSKPDYPGSRPDWDGTTCVACPLGSEWDMTLRACRCTGGRGWNTAGTCECPDGTPWWDAGVCKPCPSSTPKFNSVSKLCEACPAGRLAWNGSACVRGCGVREVGRAHPIGGGFISGSASVSSSVYVGPNFSVCGNARVSGNRLTSLFYGKVSGNAQVSGAVRMDGGIITGNARVSGPMSISAGEDIDERRTRITGGAIMGGGQVSGGTISGGIVYESARVSGGRISGGRVYGSARVSGGRISGGRVHGSARVSGGRISGGRVHGSAQVSGSAQIMGGNVLGGTISGGTISGRWWTTDVYGGTISGGTISGGEVHGGTISGNVRITGGHVRGGRISGGTISGGAVWGGTIVGGTISGGRVSGSAQVRGGTISGGRVSGSAQVRGGTISGGRVSGTAIIRDGQHIQSGVHR